MRVAMLGGESANRKLFGGKHKRLIPVVVIGGLFLLVGIFIQWVLIVGAVFVALALLALSPGVTGSLWERVVKRRRWRWRENDGTTVYLPFDQELWDVLTDAVANAKTRKERKAATRNLHAMRETPDGLDGFRWLHDARHEPGIQWHRPAEGDQYLAVTFATTGQVDGVGSDTVYDQASESFGRLTAGLGDPLTLPTRIQTLVRTLPPDSARHEAWIEDQVDPAAPGVLAVSYKENLDTNRNSALIPRHFVVVSWPVTGTFERKAATLHEGQAGYVALMMREISRMASALTNAGFQDVRALTARQTAAVIRHMQVPSFPIDRVSDITPMGGFLPSEDSWHSTTYFAQTGRSGLSQTLVRTARIDVESIEGSQRNALWMHPMLSHMGDQIPRTLTFHQELSPQATARTAADKDVTSDDADRISRAKDGRLEDLETAANLSAAMRRRLDLAPGTGHVGAAWVGYLSVSAGDRKQLRDACEAMQAAASNAGLGQLEWMDTQSSTAAAFCWPTGRGILPAEKGRGEQVFTGMESLASEVESL
ncbi:hypothetical protein ACIPY5_19870 [Microbacterium sp. NPDC089698]|uniref:hypothetical protein n=1 Tax=Microbacterium sp. NPDC089698 TaxID=3364200 RepID=UPI00381A3517